MEQSAIDGIILQNHLVIGGMKEGVGTLAADVRPRHPTVMEQFQNHIPQLGKGQCALLPIGMYLRGRKDILINGQIDGQIFGKTVLPTVIPGNLAFISSSIYLINSAIVPHYSLSYLKQSSWGKMIYYKFHTVLLKELSKGNRSSWKTWLGQRGMGD